VLLSGLVRCAGCRYGTSHNTLSDGQRRYKCRVEHSAGRCPALAVVAADLIESYVVERFLAALEEEGGRLVTVVDEREQLEPLHEALQRSDATFVRCATTRMRSL
jgi:hypothetical protein